MRAKRLYLVMTNHEPDAKTKMLMSRAIDVVDAAADDDREYLFHLARTAMVELAYDGELDVVRLLEQEAKQLQALLSRKGRKRAV